MNLTSVSSLYSTLNIKCRSHMIVHDVNISNTQYIHLNYLRKIHLLKSNSDIKTDHERNNCTLKRTYLLSEFQYD